MWGMERAVRSARVDVDTGILKDLSNEPDKQKTFDVH